MQVREAALKDRDQVFDLMSELMRSPAGAGETPVNRSKSEATFRRIIEDKTAGAIFVAEEDGVLLGLVTLSYPMAVRCGGIYACIEEFIVSERARGKGAGGKLLEAAKAHALKMGCHEIQVNRPSEAGYPVYLRHGWKDLGKHLSLKCEG